MSPLSTTEPSPAETERGWPRWAPPAATGAVMAAATAYTTVMNPNTSSAFPLCPLRALTGIDCPGCGGLRAVHALTHGHVVDALDFNAMAVIVLPVLAVAWVLWMGRSLGLRLPQVRLGPRTGIAVIAAMIVFGVVRNLPVDALEVLRSSA